MESLDLGIKLEEDYLEVQTQPLAFLTGRSLAQHGLLRTHNDFDYILSWPLRDLIQRCGILLWDFGLFCLGMQMIRNLGV